MEFPGSEIDPARLAERLSVLAAGELSPPPTSLRAWMGARAAPPIVLVHGHATTFKVWTDPYNESLGEGLIPLDFSLTDCDRRPQGIYFPEWRFKNVCFATPMRLLPDPPPCYWDTLRREGYSLLTWSQAHPNGTIQHAVRELAVVLRLAEETFGTSRFLVLVHSRGGLVARRLLQQRPELARHVIGLVMLSTPNHGSKIAALSRSASRVKPLLDRFLGDKILAKAGEDFRESALKYVGSLLAFFQGEAIRELRPRSRIMREMAEGIKAERALGIPYYLFAGHDNRHNRLYLIRDREKGDLVELLCVLDGLWNFAMPSELRDDKGDGLVAVKRAVLGWERRRKLFRANHASILVHRDAQLAVLGALAELTAEEAGRATAGR